MESSAKPGSQGLSRELSPGQTLNVYLEWDSIKDALLPGLLQIKKKTTTAGELKARSEVNEHRGPTMEPPVLRRTLKGEMR